MAELDEIVILSQRQDMMMQVPVFPGQDEQGGEREDLHLVSIIRVWWYYRWRVAMISLSITIIAAIFLANQEKVYTAKALVMINDISNLSVKNGRKPIKGKKKKPNIENSIVFMSSIDFLKLVAEKANLYSDPEFIPPSSDLSSFKGRVVIETNVLEALADRLTVAQLGGAQVISIEMVSNDPGKAARIANAAAQIFIDEGLKRLKSLETSALAWLAEKSNKLKFDLLTLEGQALETAIRYGLQGFDEETSISQALDTQKNELTRQLTMAKAEGAEIQARSGRADSLTIDGRTEVSLATLKSPALEELKNVETMLLIQFSNLAQELGKHHPKMVSLRNDLDATRQQQRTEEERIQSELRGQILVNSARQAEIEAHIDNLDKKITNQQMANIELRDFKRKINTVRNFLDRIIEQRQRITEKQSIEQSIAKIMSKASTPTMKSHPIFWPLVPYISFCGILFGLVVVFFYERWVSDFGFKNLRQLRNAELEPIGMIPKYEASRDEGTSIELICLGSPKLIVGRSVPEDPRKILVFPTERAQSSHCNPHIVLSAP